MGQVTRQPTLNAIANVVLQRHQMVYNPIASKGGSKLSHRVFYPSFI